MPVAVRTSASPISSGAAPLFMQIGGVSGTASNTQAVISFSAANTINPGYGSPQQIYSSLTNLFGKGPVTSAATLVGGPETGGGGPQVGSGLGMVHVELVLSQLAGYRQ